MRSRATARDVGALAGVSTASVSRVLSGNRPVSDEVRDKVEAAAVQLGYVPNHFGRALRQRRSGTFGLVVPAITNPFFPALIEALEASARGEGYHVLIANSHYDPDVERQRLRELAGMHVDACLVVPASYTASSAAITEAHGAMTVIQYDGCAQRVDVPHVGMDNAAAVTALVEHLEALGRRDIVFVSGGLRTSPDIERDAAFVRLAVRPDVQSRLTRLDSGDYSFDAGRSAAEALVRSRPTADAVVCSNDVIALGLINGLALSGRRVPDDVAVCGIDGLSLAQLFPPGLTTVVQPLQEMARRTVEWLSSDDPQPEVLDRSSSIPGTLVVGASSGSVG